MQVILDGGKDALGLLTLAQGLQLGGVVAQGGGQPKVGREELRGAEGGGRRVGRVVRAYRLQVMH